MHLKELLLVWVFVCLPLRMSESDVADVWAKASVEAGGKPGKVSYFSFVAILK